jgi:uncharacterized phage protein gp47/JayE
MPLTDLGFKRRSFDEILSDKVLKAQELFGNDINTSDKTPLGKFLRINAYDQALTEEEAENIYYSIFPSTATGQSLDRLCWAVGISRNPAIAAEYTVKVTGEAGTEFPVGTLVSTDSELTFYCAETKTVGSDGTVEATVVCTQAGIIGNIAATDIVKIVNPVANLSGAIGVSQTVVGEEVENDYSLRRRYDIAKEGLGSCNETSIKSALMSIPTVSSVSIAANDTDETDSEGRPPRSFECYISGGEDYHEQIAETIFDKKPIGIKTHGTITQNIMDEGGYSHAIQFSHTTDIGVYVRIAITTTTEFSDDTAKAVIKTNIIDYINNVGVGNPVILSALYGLIHSVSGVKEVTAALLSTDGSSFNASNITATSYQNCVFKQLEINQNGGGYKVVS